MGGGPRISGTIQHVAELATPLIAYFAEFEGRAAEGDRQILTGFAGAMKRAGAP